MELNEYQRRAMITCMKSSDNFSYMLLNLVGEVGEFASKVAKEIRKGQAMIVRNEYVQCIDDETDKDVDAAYKREVELQKECGDIMWQLFGLMSVMDWSAEDIAWLNINKLHDRAKAGTIDGNGDGVDGNERTK